MDSAGQRFEEATRKLVDQMGLEGSALEWAPADVQEQLRVAIEDLRIAEEELRDQNEQLYLSHEALDRERQLFLDLFDSAPVGYVVTDHNGRIKQVNRAATALLRAESRSLRITTMTALIPLEARREVHQALVNLTRTGAPQHFESLLKRADGVETPVEIRLSCSPPRGGNDVRWLLIDLSQRKRAEQAELERLELQKVNEVQEHLMSLISHELRTPLTMVLGNADMLAERGSSLPEEERDLALASIREETRQLHAMIDNMLALKHREQQVELEPVLLQHTVQGVARRFQTMAHNRELRVDIDPDLPPILGQTGYIEQVLNNFLSNAHKYSPDGEPIAVCAGRDGDDAILLVQDRGPGIPEHERTRLFQPFFRSSEVEGRVRGIGLGLSVCRLLAETLDGAVWAEPRKGGGTTFGLRLSLLHDE